MSNSTKPPREVWVLSHCGVTFSVYQDEAKAKRVAAGYGYSAHRYRLDDEPAPGTRWVVRQNVGGAFLYAITARPPRAPRHSRATKFTSREAAFAFRDSHWPNSVVVRLVPKRKATK